MTTPTTREDELYDEIAALKRDLAAAQSELASIKKEAETNQKWAFLEWRQRAQRAEALAEKYKAHAGAMRLWIGSQAWKVDEETTREAGLTLVTLFDAAIDAARKP